MSSCCPSRGELDALLKGTLPAAESAGIDQHLSECAVCRQTLNALADSDESWLKAKQTGPADPVSSPPLREAMNRLKVGDLPSLEKAGDRIGRYKLLQQIGEGGCGVVYMAEQEEPVRRRVALKIIKLGMDTKSVIARFEAERQALAMMDHPNIAKVFDAGTTETGRPYFVMELVRGMKITDYCDEKKLPTRQRLDLFIQVCQAIQHAHQKGIIHRDIKPSNILVSMNDGLLVPKVIDFGIAKATTGQQLTDKTLFTAFEQFIGTPAYMSPEQAVITNVDIDTRSDIYALGVLLYEMLTGRTPFDAKELLAAGLDEMRRTIRDQEPPRPSTRLSSLPDQELSTTAQRRGLDAPKLVSELCGDLDWIVMKALEKDRARRYETANGLAMDIQRHLSNEPVAACPPSRVYRFQKLVRRNKLAFSAATAVATALLVGVIVSAWQAERARRAEGVAKAERDSAEAVLKFFREKILAVGRPEGQEGGLGKDVTLRKAIDEAESQITASFQNRPLVEAAIRHTLGEGYAYLGEMTLAIQQLERAAALRRTHSGSDHPDTLKSMSKLGVAYADAGKAEQAFAVLDDALTRRTKRLGPDHQDTIQSMNDLATALWRARKLDEAVALVEKALELSKARLGPKHETTLGLVNDLSVVYLYKGQKDKAIPLLEGLLELYRAKSGPEHLDTITVMHNLGQAYLQAHKVSEAILLYEEAFKVAKAKLGVEHPKTQGTLYWLRTAYRDRGQLDKALSLYENTLKELKAKVGSEHRATFDTISGLAGLRAQQGEFAQAAAELLQVREGNPGNHRLWHEIAALLVASGQIEVYREHCRQSVELFGKTTDPPTAERIAKDCLILPGSGADMAVVAKMADTAAAAAVTNHSATPWFQLVKGLAEYRQGRFAEAVEWLNKTLTDTGKELKRDVQAYMALAMAQYQLKEIDAARAAFAKGAEIEQTKMPKLESGDIGGGWWDWIIAHALMREAKALIDDSGNKAETK